MINFIPSTRLFTFLLLLGTLTLSSCAKKDEVVQETSVLRYINASPTLGTFNIYANTIRLNTAAIPFGGGVSYAQYVSGLQSIVYTTASDTQPLLTKQITLANGKGYTLYLIDKNDKLDALLVTDEMPTSTSTKSFVKFYNLSPDAPALNLDISDGSNLVKDKTYKTGSDFVTLDAKTYTFQIKDASTGTVKATLTDVDIAAGRYYTIIARGLLTPGANDQPFSGQSIINN